MPDIDKILKMFGGVSGEGKSHGAIVDALWNKGRDLIKGTPAPKEQKQETEAERNHRIALLLDPNYEKIVKDQRGMLQRLYELPGELTPKMTRDDLVKDLYSVAGGIGGLMSGSGASGLKQKSGEQVRDAFMYGMDPNVSTLESAMKIASLFEPNDPVGQVLEMSGGVPESARSAYDNADTLGQFASMLLPIPGAGKVKAANTVAKGAKSLKFAIDNAPEAARLVAEHAPEAAKVIERVLPTAEKAVQEGITAYHGSPHNYSAERLIKWPDGRTEYIVGTPDVLPTVPKGAEVVKDFPLGRQRLDKIGTGEGAQAYGHGLYEAEAEAVGLGYKNELSGREFKLGDGRVIRDDVTSRSMGQTRAENIAAQHINDAFNSQSSSPYQFAKDRLLKAKRYYPEEAEHIDEALAIVDDWNRSGASAPRATGSMYQVKINASPDEFLDWDKPLSQQPESVRKALASIDEDMYNPVGGDYDANEKGQQTYHRLMKMFGESKASAVLKGKGIPGIKYLDGASRTAGEGSRNYVVFDDSLIDILKKYGVALPAIGLLQQYAKQNNGAVPESMIAPLLTKKKDHK